MSCWVCTVPVHWMYRSICTKVSPLQWLIDTLYYHSERKMSATGVSCAPVEYFTQSTRLVLISTDLNSISQQSIEDSRDEISLKTGVILYNPIRIILRICSVKLQTTKIELVGVLFWDQHENLSQIRQGSWQQKLLRLWLGFSVP
jgi:hypothetical protein